ncbi:positive regulation of delayed rectifier potassium channel activity [Sparganum proliferum]
MIAVVESILSQTEVTVETKSHIRHQVSSLLMAHRPREVLSKVERDALRELKADNELVIVPADKGRATVVLDRTDYLQKAKEKTDTSEILEASAPFVFRGTQFLASALTKKMATSGQLGRSAEESQVKSASSCLHFRPNYFVCQRITNSELLTGLTRIIEHVCSEQTIYAPFAYSSARLHLTWCTFYAADKHEAERALACFHTARTDLCQLAPRDSLRVQGVGQFSNHLLYASVIPDPTLATFAEKILAILRSENVATPGNKHPFTPHLTLIKRNPKAKRILKSNLIDLDLLTDFQETYFGDQVIDSLDVCAMHSAKKKDEFYELVGSIRLKNDS